MKCLKCNSEILNEYIICPGCGTSVEELKRNNLIKNDQVISNQNSFQNNVIETSFVNDEINSNQLETKVINEEVNKVKIEAKQEVNENSQEQPSIIESVGIKEEKFNKDLKGKSRIPIVIASILIIVVLAFVGVAGYIFVNSPKKMFSSIINKAYETYNSVIASDALNATSISTEFDLKTNVKTSDEDMGPIINILNKLSVKGKTQIDYKNKLMSLNFGSTYDNKEVVNVDAYLKDEKIYVLLKDIYEKYISEDVSGINEVFETYDYVEDIKIIFDEVVNAVNNSLKDEYFTSERVKMNVDGKESTVNKVTLLLNYENTKALAIDLLSYLQASNQFVESYSKITESNKSDIINDLQDEINTIKNDTNGDDSIIKIILYTKGFSNEFVGLEIITESEDENVNISVINDKKDTFTLLFKENYKDTEEVLNGSVEIINNKYNFTITNEEMVVKGSLVNENNKFDIDVNYIFEGNEIGLDLYYLINYNEKVTIPNLTNSVNFESITDEEGMNILNSLMEKEGVKDLMAEIKSQTDSVLDKSKFNAMATYGARVLSNVETTYYADSLTQNITNPVYYNISSIMSTDDYYGCVKVMEKDNNLSYSIIMYNSSNQLKIEGYFENSTLLNSSDVVKNWEIDETFDKNLYTSETCKNGLLKNKLDSYNSLY